MSIIALVTGHPGPSRRDDPQACAAALRARTAALSALDPVRFPNVTAAAVPLASCADDDSYYDTGMELVAGRVRILASRLSLP